MKFLLNLESDSIGPSQIDMITYAGVLAMNDLLKLRGNDGGRQITAFVDAFMSNMVRVFHPMSSDPSILGSLNQIDFKLFM